MNDWQQSLDRSFRDGAKKGELVILKSRSKGKSMYQEITMQMRFNSAWSEWKGVWTWKPMVSTHTGKMIWGNIMRRENKLMLGTNGRKVTEYVSPKEALKDQREEFKRVLS